MGSNILANLQGNLTRLGKLQEQLSSGKLITRPSDSPAGTVSSMELRGQVRSTAQYLRNVDNGMGWLSTIDTALTSSMGMVGRIRDLTLQGKSTGSQSAESRAAIAAEVEQLRGSLLGMANSVYLDRPVFGGTTAGSTAYADGVYTGDSNPVSRTVADNANVRVDVTGPEVFGTGSDELFTIVADIAEHLRSAPEELTADLARLDVVRERMQNAVSDIGARQARMETMRGIAEDRGISLNSSLAEIESIDLPATIVELQMQQTAYQAALGAASKIIQPSLVDFLR
jgi:flagellar hook-associated protein 3 FlgL